MVDGREMHPRGRGPWAVANGVARTSVALVAVVAGACGADAGSDRWEGTVRDSAGIVLVENRGAGAWGEGMDFRFETELRLGAEGARPELMFGRIADVAVDTSGRIYVLEPMAREVRVFDRNGEFLRRIGRRGAGPGEFGPGAAAVLVHDDVLFVPDPGQGHVEAFSMTGGHRGSFSVGEGRALPLRWVGHPAGGYVVQVRTVAGGARDEPVRDRLIRVTPFVSEPELLLEMPAGRSFEVRGGMPVFRFFEPEPAWTVLSDGSLVVARNDRYHFEIYDASGRLRGIATRPTERLPVRDRDREAVKAYVREAYVAQGMRRDRIEAALAEATFASEFPAFALLLPGPGGSLWVQRIRTAAESGWEEGTSFNALDLGAPVWDVFDRDGRYLGAVRLPEAFTPTRIRAQRVYGVARDASGVESVLVLRLTGTGAAALALREAR